MSEPVSSEMFTTYFSNFSAHAIEYKGTVYPTAEHAYQCMRFADQRIRAEILAARSPEKACELAQKHKSVQMRDFEDRKLEIMEKLLRLKFEQHESVRQALSDTGNREIIKHTVTSPLSDGFWGDGPDGRGENHHGRLWMSIRKELRH